MKTSHVLLVSMLAGLSMLSCRSEKKQAEPRNAEISCDESFKPIIEEEIDVFEATFTEVSIIPRYTSEVEALNLLLQDSVRLAVSTRPLTEGEINTLHAKKLFPKETVIAIDGIAFIVNKLNNDSVISVPDLRKIVTGEITQWKQLNPKSKLGDLLFVFDNRNSSTVRYAIDSLCQGKPLYNGLKALGTNPDVIKFVSETPNAIGVIGASWINAIDSTNRQTFIDDVRVMNVKADLGSIPYKPYQAYIGGYEGQQYPLTRLVYIISTDPKVGIPTQFANFVAGYKGQKIILKTGIVPIQASTLNSRQVNVKSEL